MACVQPLLRWLYALGTDSIKSEGDRINQIPFQMGSITKRGRKLVDGLDVFSQNAWDDTDWTSEMYNDACRRCEQQKKESTGGDHANIEAIEERVVKKWDSFYQTHRDRFFKDRKWIFSEFPEVLDTKVSLTIFEVGCGVGNAVANLIESNPNASFFCCDISSCAINTLEDREFYKNHKDRVIAFQADIVKDFDSVIRGIIEEESVDYVMMIFTLSALKPEVMKRTVSNLATLLRPGGSILFRDYGMYDLAQLRFKGTSLLRDNYYVRADGTTSYFFTKDYLDDLFSSAGLSKVELREDNRMLVNRRKSLKMCRRWIQARYSKPS